MADAKVKKVPHLTPDRDERCRLRGNQTATGTLLKYDPASNWATVGWDSGVVAPKLVHRFELMRL